MPSQLQFSATTWAAVLLAGALLALVVGGAQIYRYSARHGGPALRAVVAEYRIVLACFAVLVLSLALTAAAAWFATPADASLLTAVLQGVTGSLIEDLAFFSLLGFIIVLVQRREADRNRNLDDKIELLFSAKQLRSGEVSYLRDELRKISADCRQSVTEIDVVSHDEVNGYVRLDVSRQYYVGNYLASEDAQHLLQFDITPDHYPGDGPSMRIFPTITNSVVEENGEWRRVADDEIVEPARALDGGQRFAPPGRRLSIRPGQVREFRSRFQAWQRLMKEAATPEADQGPDGAPPCEADAFELTLMKHWDEIQIHIRNSLPGTVRTTISGNESRTFEVLSGDEQKKAYRVENLTANSRIYISFAPE